MRYQVIIAGGGPAGSMAGYLLGSKGIKCLLLDKALFPRDKPCGGAITPRALELFPFLTPFMELGIKTTVCHYRTPDQDMIFHSTNPLFYLVRRIKFDYDLLQLAKTNHCEVIEGVKVLGYREDKEKIIVKCSNGVDYETDFLLGADGVSSTVRENSPLKRFWNKKTVGLAFRSEIELDPKLLDPARTLHIHFGFDKMRSGYGWVFLKSTHLNVGYGELMTKTTKSADIKRQYEKYVLFCQQHHILPSIEMPKLSNSWLLQGSGPMKQFATRRIFLLGDSAGFVHPISGEGIIYGMWSAKLATEFISQYYTQKTCSVDDLYKKYMRECWKAFGTDLRRLAMKTSSLPHVIEILFQLARFDDLIKNAVFHISAGDTSLFSMRKRLIWRVIIGIFKGHLWKKSPSINKPLLYGTLGKK